MSTVTSVTGRASVAIHPADTTVLTLVSTQSQLGLRPVVLHPGRYTIGSSPQCQIRVTAAGVHPLHCMIVATARQLLLKAWDHRTWVNNGPATERRLKAGDRLLVGPIEFMLRESTLEEQLSAFAAANTGSSQQLLSQPAHAVTRDNSPRSATAVQSSQTRAPSTEHPPSAPWPTTSHPADEVKKNSVVTALEDAIRDNRAYSERPGLPTEPAPQPTGSRVPLRPPLAEKSRSTPHSASLRSRSATSAADEASEWSERNDQLRRRESELATEETALRHESRKMAIRTKEFQAEQDSFRILSAERLLELKRKERDLQSQSEAIRAARLQVAADRQAAVDATEQDRLEAAATLQRAHDHLRIVESARAQLAAERANIEQWAVEQYKQWDNVRQDRAALARRQADFERRQLEFQQAKAELVKVRRTVTDAQAELEQSRQRTQDERAELESQKQDFQNKVTATQQLQSTLDSRSQQIESSQAALAQQQQKIESDRRTVESEKERLGALARQLDTQAETLRSREQELASRTDTLCRLTRELHRARQQQATYTDELASRATQLAEIARKHVAEQKSLTERNAKLSAQEVELAQERESLADQALELDDRTRALEVRNQELQTWDRKLTGRASSLERRENTTSSREQTIEATLSTWARREADLERDREGLSLQQSAFEVTRREIVERLHVNDAWEQELSQRAEFLANHARRQRDAREADRAWHAELAGRALVVGRLTATLRDSYREIAAREDELAARTTELANAVKAFRQNCSELSQQREQFVNEKAEWAKSKSRTITEQQATIEGLQSEVESLQTSLTEKQASRQSLEVELASEWQRIEETSRNLAKQREELDTRSDAVESLRTSLKADREALQAEQRSLEQRQIDLTHERESLANERRQLDHAQTTLKRDRMQLEVEQKRLKSEHSQLTEERRQLTADRTAWADESTRQRAGAHLAAEQETARRQEEAAAEETDRQRQWDERTRELNQRADALAVREAALAQKEAELAVREESLQAEAAAEADAASAIATEESAETETGSVTVDKPAAEDEVSNVEAADVNKVPAADETTAACDDGLNDLRSKIAAMFELPSPKPGRPQQAGISKPTTGATDDIESARTKDDSVEKLTPLQAFERAIKQRDEGQQLVGDSGVTSEDQPCHSQSRQQDTIHEKPADTPSETVPVATSTDVKAEKERFELDDAENPDSVARYMQGLLERTRRGNQPSQTRQPAPRQHTPERKPAASIERTSGAKRPLANHSAQPAVNETSHVEREEVQRTSKPRTQVNKDALRANLHSMREVANLSARSALAKYSWKQTRNRLVVQGLLVATSWTVAGVLAVMETAHGLRFGAATTAALTVGGICLAFAGKNLWDYRCNLPTDRSDNAKESGTDSTKE